MSTSSSRSDTGTSALGAQLRSSRWVTSGYRNVFHRAFLYGMGLTDHDLGQPFAGLALAHNEAAPGQALVKSLGDLTKRGLSAVGFTERQFVVPETRATPETSVTYRELAADSAELAVRGHWYDALVGVSASVPATFGLAQAILRLGIPGVVLIPSERLAIDADLAVAAQVLEAVGLGAVISVDDDDVLDDCLRSVHQQVCAGIAHPVDMAQRRVDFSDSLPGIATNGAVFAHVCALAFELGITDAAELINAELSHITVGWGENRIISIGAVPLSDSPFAVDDSNPDRLTLKSEDSESYVVIPEKSSGHVLDAAEGRIIVVPTDADLEFIAGSRRVEIKCTNDRDDSLFSIGTMAGCVHPGYVDSNFNYFRL